MIAHRGAGDGRKVTISVDKTNLDDEDEVLDGKQTRLLLTLDAQACR